MLLFVVIFTSKWCWLCNVQCIWYTKFIVCMLLGQRVRSWKTCRKCWEVETSVSPKNSEQQFLSLFFSGKPPIWQKFNYMEVLIAENWKIYKISYFLPIQCTVNQIFIQNRVTTLTNHHELITSKILDYLDLLL